ncbi:MAG: thiamine-phosphate kinase [Pseudomonadota bacterium]
MNESDWIQRYIAPLVTAPGAVGLTDDVAMLSGSGTLIATMDTLVEGVHFLASDSLRTVGRKLVRVNVSDIIAKGAEPVEALLSIAWPKGRSEGAFVQFIEGLAHDLKTYKISLIGGDLVRTDGPLTVTLTLTGQCLRGEPVRRSGGQAGQSLWISDEIGWGGAGLKAAKSGQDERVANRYRVPKIGNQDTSRTIAGVAHASLDVSDGLFIDVMRLASASGCGALIELETVPLAEPTDHLEAIFEQCTAGDDYCVLMSAPENIAVPGFKCIGKLTESLDLTLTLQGRSVNPPSILGFEHSL